MTKFRNVLLTGALGRIGSVLREALAPECALLRVSDIRPIGAVHPNEHAMVCDLGDQEGVRELCQNIDAVIHMGGRPKDGPWRELLPSNLQTTLNILAAASEAGVDRVLIASSNHVTGMYPAGRRVGPNSPARPDSVYALTKAFSEDAAAYYAYKFGLRALSLRIGSFSEKPKNRRALSTWCSHGDMIRLIEAGLTADYAHEIVYGVSNNLRSWWDNPGASRIGFYPQDNAELFAEQVENVDSEDPLERDMQGADRSADGFRGRLAWIHS